MQKFQTSKVFTPTSPAINTFIERENKINNHLVDALNTPGKQIVLYGHSGCGKTTLLINKLSQTYESTITTRCMEGMTFESILLDGFDQLGCIYKDSSTKSKGFKISPSITLSYHEIRATINLGEINNQEQSINKPAISPQLTPQRLAKFFGEAKSCWILEDFHKIKGVEKSKTSQFMKIFMDLSVEYPDLKLIALGAVGTARQVIEYDKEMNNRVSEIYIPYMKPVEIRNIVSQGEKLLNLIFSKEVKEKIVKYSCGLPSVCHQLCLNICFDKRILETVKSQTSINTSDLDNAIEKFVDEKSDTLKAEFDKAIKISNNIAINIPKEILKACLKINNDEFSFDEIYKNLLTKKVGKEEVEKYLNELCSSKRSDILVYDDNSNTYHFNNLFLKAYSQLQFKDDKDGYHIIRTEKDNKIVARLLEIIEKEISEDNDEFFIEDLST